MKRLQEGIGVWCVGALLLSGWGVRADDQLQAQGISKAEEAAIEQLGKLKEACGVFMESEDGEKLVAALKSHTALFKACGINAVNTWVPSQCEGMLKGLRKISSEIKISITFRELLLTSSSPKSFARKALAMAQKEAATALEAKLFLWGKSGQGQRWKEFENMEDETFVNTKKDLLKDWQWKLDIDDMEKDLVWNDEFTGQDKTCSFLGEMAVEGEHGEGFGKMLAAAHRVGVRKAVKVDIGEGGGQPKSLADRLGLKVRSLGDEEMKMSSIEVGAVVTHVTPDGLADYAGIRMGDTIIKVGKDVIVDSSSFRKALKTLEYDASFSLTYVRALKKKSVTIENGASGPRVKRRGEE